MIVAGKPKRTRYPIWRLAPVVTLLLVAGGCIPKKDNEVVVYTALDREFSQPILSDLAEELKLTIRSKYDQESNKTVGLANEILLNAKRPQADIFWNNEILQTLRLAEAGVLEVYQSPQQARYPKSFHSPAGNWHAFAARARVLIINTDLLPGEKDWPDSIHDLADKKWKGRCTIARPVFGTTATHAAAIVAALGDDGKKLLAAIGANAIVEGGNKQVALKVSSGQCVFGITDTDDAMVEYEQGKPVAIVFPDQGEGELGTLVIPNTLALVKNGPNAERAKRLVDHLLMAPVETRLSKGASAQIPLATDVHADKRLMKIAGREGKTIRKMALDFDKLLASWHQSKGFFAQLGASQSN